MSTDQIDKLYKNYEILSDAKEKILEVSSAFVFLLEQRKYFHGTANHAQLCIKGRLFKWKDSKLSYLLAF